VSDNGLVYDAARGFGWDAAVLVKKRDMLPNDCRDHFVQVVNTSTATWNLDVPNGQYLSSPSCAATRSPRHAPRRPRRRDRSSRRLRHRRTVRRCAPTCRSTSRTDASPWTLGGSGQITSTKVGCIDVEPAGIDTPPRPRPRGDQEVDGAAFHTRLQFASSVVRDAARFTLELAQPSAVRLSVHDVRGRVVANLRDADLPAGRHSFTWQTRDPHGRRLPSGVYFLRLESPILHETRKLVVIR